MPSDPEIDDIDRIGVDCRVVWLYFSVAWWPGDAREYGDAVRKGEWRDE